MICMNTFFHVGDNSGAKIVRLIRIPGQASFRARPGTIVRVSVISADPKSSLKPGTKHLAVVSGLKSHHIRSNGASIKFDKNTVLMLTNDKKGVGTRVLSPISNEIRLAFPDIASKAKEVY